MAKATRREGEEEGEEEDILSPREDKVYLFSSGVILGAACGSKMASKCLHVYSAEERPGKLRPEMASG